VRYFLLREVPFGNDGDFSHRAMVNRLNGDLANAFGNLVQRTLSLVAKNCGGKVPEPGAFTAEDQALLAEAHGLLEGLRTHLHRQAFHEAFDAIWTVVRSANGYIDAQAPWSLRKTDPARMATVLYVLVEVIRHLATVMQPFTPTAAGKILDQLAIPPDQRNFDQLAPGHELAPGTALPAPAGVFPRFAETTA
jgi:methionyl-tRNA synthetase